MSGKIVGWAMDQKTGSSTTKLVLVKLADCAGDEGFCWPSVEVIADHTELSDRAVRNALQRLEEIRLVRIDRGRRYRGRQSANAYILAIPGSEDLTFDEVQAIIAGGPRIKRQTARGAGSQTAPRSIQPARGAIQPACGAGIYRRTVKEPSENHRPPAAAAHRAPAWDGREVPLIDLIGEDAFGFYFRDTTLADGSVLTILFGTATRRDYAKSKFEPAIVEAFGTKEICLLTRAEWKAQANVSPSQEKGPESLPYWLSR